MQYKITDAISLGRSVRERRKKLGYTQAYLSDVTGLSVTFISDLENGKPTIELGKSIFLINMLGMDVELNERG
jgi:HTH-type transcriptional regulator / antitoxin HipB